MQYVLCECGYIHDMLHIFPATNQCRFVKERQTSCLLYCICVHIHTERSMERSTCRLCVHQLTNGGATVLLHAFLFCVRFACHIPRMWNLRFCFSPPNSVSFSSSLSLSLYCTCGRIGRRTLLEQFSSHSLVNTCSHTPLLTLLPFMSRYIPVLHTFSNSPN